MTYLHTKNLSHDSFFPLNTHTIQHNNNITHLHSMSSTHTASKSLDYFSIKPKLSLDIIATSPQSYISDSELDDDQDEDSLVDTFDQIRIANSNEDFSPLTPFEDDHQHHQKNAPIHSPSATSATSLPSSTNIKLVLPNLYPYKFLIVDDNLINLKILNRILLKIYPRAIITQVLDSTKVEHMLLVEQNQFDSIFIDIEMPKVDGLQIANIVRTNTKFNHIPLIAVTTRNSPCDLKLFKDKGIDYTFNKPLNFKLDFIGSIVDSIIEKRSSN